MRRLGILVIVALLLSTPTGAPGRKRTEDVSSQPPTTQPEEKLSLARRKELEAKLKSAKKRGWQLYKEKRSTEATVEYETAVRLAVKLYGKEHLRTARLYHNLAYQYWKTGEFGRAEPLYLRSLAIEEAKLGKDHPGVAISLNNLARLYRSMGQYTKAEPLYLRSLAIKEAKLGKDHPSVAISLNNLGLLYDSMGEYAKAKPLLLRALKIFEAKRHPDLVTSLHTLAGLYWHMGEYAKAERLYLRGLAIKEAKLGKDHPSVAISLNNLGLLYRSMGQYTKAELLYLRSLQIREAKLGKDHPSVAIRLNNLAVLYRSMGQYTKAERLYLRGLAIKEANLGKDHPSVAISLNNLGLLYGSMGEYAKAKPLLLRALKIFEAKRHPDLATSLHTLAGLYRHMGEYAKAERLYLRGLAIKEAELGKDHPSVAISLNDLGLLYESMGQYTKAEPLYLRSLAIKEAKLGKDHPSVAISLSSLTHLYWRMGQYAKAEPLARRAMEIFLRSRARTSHAMLSRASYHGKHVCAGNLAICLTLKLGKSTDALELLERNLALGLRELLAEAKASSSGVLDEADGRRISAALAKINALNTSAQRQVKKGPPTKSLLEAIKQAERTYTQLLLELGEKHQQFVATETARGVTSKQITRSLALDDETAIIGWVWHDKSLWGYVIRRSGVKWVDLSRGFNRAAQRRLRKRILTAAHTPATSRLSPADLHRMYNESLAPLTPHLKEIRKLIVIAQDWTAYLPVEMLLTQKPSTGAGDVANWPWLDKKYQISYAASVTTLDILCKQRAKRKDRQWSRPLFALADPPFSNKQLALMKSEKDSPLGQVLASAHPAKRSDSMLTRLLRFDARAVPRRLPGTRREVRMIAGLLGQQSLLLLGPDASERKLFEASKTGKLKQCRYIHLATHGFADSDRPEFSGLALARVPADKDYDGILHMREVFQLKLDADLVVLSACQTGLGKNLSGEGMLGLSTAFFFAGTQSIVMSVWNVPDAPTALLMHRFYSNLKAGKTKAAALRDAKNWLRNLTREDLKKLGQADPTIGQLTRGFQVTTAPKGHRTATKPFAHPHYWAGFILTGDPQ
jgi:CHAT domain-containing protein